MQAHQEESCTWEQDTSRAGHAVPAGFPRSCRVFLPSRRAVTLPRLCLCADFDGAEVRQSKAEGRERSAHSCHQQALQIGSLSEGRTRRGVLHELPTPHQALPPLILLSQVQQAFQPWDQRHTCLALPFAVHSLPALFSPTTRTPAILRFLI